MRGHPSFMSRLRDDQRGVTAVVVSVCLFALFGAMMLTLDAGNLWATRRQIVTGTDAAALHAAQFFDSGGGDPCSADDLAVAENGAADVMMQNHSRALHNPADTPDGFEVTTLACGLGGYTPGKVRFDGRLSSLGFFSGAFGFSNLSAYSSSTAAWGYIVAIGDDLRPIPVCDKSEGYEIWTDYWETGYSPAGLTTYNSYFGRDEGNPDLNLIEFPASSTGYINGHPNGVPGRNPNEGLPYAAPDGIVGSHTTVHRVTMPDAACGVEPGNWLWIDFEDEEGGSASANVLADWILHGYQGTVALDPHDCNPGNENPTPEDCGTGPGAKSSLEKALSDVTCPVATPARDCDYVFPILVVSGVEAPTGGGDNVHYVQVAFLFVVIRGYGAMSQDNVDLKNVQIDMEFLDVKTSGQVSGSPPTTTHPYQTGTQLCGADHDSVGDRCPF